MSFIPVKSDNGAVLPWEYMPAAAGTYQAGQLLSMSGGQLAALSRIIYALVGIAGLWCITLLFRERDSEE